MSIKKKFGNNSSVYDPGFVNEEAGNFALVATSNLIDKGITPVGITYTDHINVSRPQGANYDIGAFEYTTDNQLPSVFIASPCSGESFNTDQPIWLESNAFDVDGNITKVVYQRGSVFLGEVTSPPYRKQIKFSSTGTFFITAYAYDNDGAIVASEEIEITIVACQSVYIEDANFEQLLIDKGFDTDAEVNNSICLNDALAIKCLDISSLSSEPSIKLTGMEEFANLETFISHGQVIDSPLNFANNKKLKHLSLLIVNASSLDISQNLDLEFIRMNYTDYNNILDLSAHTKLTVVDLFNAHVTGLNIQNGNNANITAFNVEGAIGSACIQVDDPVASAGYGHWQKDSSDMYSLDCSMEWSESVTLTPTHDAYLQGSQGKNLVTIAAGAMSNRKAYLMFDLSSINGSITGVELEFTTAHDQGSGPVNFYFGDSNNWTESGITTSNAPNMGSLLGTINKSYNTGITESVILDEDEFVIGQNSIIIEQEASGNQFFFASKEHNVYDPPRLVVYYLPNQQTSLKASIGDDTFITQSLVLSPNPVSTSMTVQGISGPKRITLMDLSGRIIYEVSSDQEEPRVDMQTYPSGIYLVRVKGIEIEKTFKVVKE